MSNRSKKEHIVQLKDFTDEGKPLLVMEYLSFGNLKVQHSLERITEEETITVLYQGLQALDYLHTQGLVHRDIKPENILIQSRRPFHIKLGDFGLATDNSILKTLCGSYCYVAPEIWKRRAYSSAVDIWSLGVIVFEYFHGLPKPPRSYKSKSWGEEIVRKIENEDWELDQVMSLLYTKMLRIESDERGSAGDCLKNLLELRLLHIGASQAGRATPTPSEQSTEIWNPIDRVTIPTISLGRATTLTPSEQSTEIEEESRSPDQLQVPSKVQKRSRSSRSSPSTQVIKEF